MTIPRSALTSRASGRRRNVPKWDAGEHAGFGRQHRAERLVEQLVAMHALKQRFVRGHDRNAGAASTILRAGSRPPSTSTMTSGESRRTVFGSVVQGEGVTRRPCAPPMNVAHERGGNEEMARFGGVLLHDRRDCAANLTKPQQRDANARARQFACVCTPAALA